jgi:hypothetical protein
MKMLRINGGAYPFEMDHQEKRFAFPPKIPRVILKKSGSQVIGMRKKSTVLSIRIFITGILPKKMMLVTGRGQKSEHPSGSRTTRKSDPPL